MEEDKKQTIKQKEDNIPTKKDTGAQQAQKTDNREMRTREKRGANTVGDKKGTKRRRQHPSAFGRPRKNRRGSNRPKSEFETRVLSARRVSRVVAGGRRFNLSVAVAVGDRKGKVGIGTGKGFDMATAMEKARNQAQKNLIEVKMTDEKSIPSDAIGKYCASVVYIRPNKRFVAGGAARIIAELVGIEHINAKIQSRSKSHLNNARATLKAFKLMKG